MSTNLELHRQAMEFADQAFVAKLNGDIEQAKDLFRQAFEKEREAAELVASDINLEPTRSVLHRSAAALAIDCGEFQEAKRLIDIALDGNPPSEIAEELRHLLDILETRAAELFRHGKELFK